MLCVCCGLRRSRPESCCERCLADFTPGGERRLADGLLVHAAYLHRGTARRLVHLLKYEAIAAAARPLAAAMAPAAAGAGVLVPVPRVTARLWRHGIDPSRELALAISRLCGLPVVAGLAPAWWHAARAGPAGKDRGVPRFRVIGAIPDDWLLVDDVLTTGTTLQAAAAALPGCGRAVVAGAAPSCGPRCR